MAETNEVLALVQARLSSSRLPGKVLKPLGTRTVLDHVVRRAQAFASDVIVCTSIDPSDNPIEAHCLAHGVSCARGSLDNVFLRFRNALLHPSVVRRPWFARLTADNPLVSVEAAKFLIRQASEELDYLYLNRQETPLGIGIELVRTSSFLAIDPDSLDPSEREHVTPRLYETPGRYRCSFLTPPAPLRYPTFRLTLDYPEDYQVLCELFAALGDDISTEEALAHLRNHPELSAINALCVQRTARTSN